MDLTMRAGVGDNSRDVCEEDMSAVNCIGKGRVVALRDQTVA